MKHIFTLLAFALLSSGQAQLPSYVPTEDLVAWYSFSGNANDESGYQNHGVVVGATLTMDRFGNENGAYHFDGSDHIEADHQSWLNSGLGSKTWAGWGRKTSGNDHAHFMTKIVATSGPYTAEATYLRLGPNNEIEFAEGQSWIGGNSVWAVVSSVLNEWVHLVGVKDVDSGNVRIYLNGVLIGEEQIQFPELEADNEGSLFIGCEHPYVSLPSGPQYFYGDLDELGIWNRALTEEEILSLYLSESLVQGCMDPMSCNFNPEAEEDDGSCLPYDALVGCMDESACNFNVNALCADDSCIYPPFNLSNCDEGEATCGPGTMWDSTTQLCIVANPADTDFDGCVQLNDLLDLLSAYGSCGFDFIVEGCTDPEAENWQEDANQDDGSCTYPFAPSESDELVFEHYLDFTGPSSCTTPELSPGEYYLEFSGTWCGGSCWNNNTTDAAYNINHPYAEDPTIPVPVCHFTWNEFCPQDDNSCASYRPTPDVYNPEHVYYYPFTSQGGSETIYGVSDECCWWDNSGGLNLRVFKVN